MSTWRTALARFDHPRQGLHRAMGRAVAAALEGAPSGDAWAAAADHAGSAGPEWRVLCGVEAARGGRDDLASAVAEATERFALGIFRRARDD